MFKLAANLSMMYQHVSLDKRFALAANDGFKAVELLWPYEFSKEQFKALLESNGLSLALINTAAGTQGQWGRAAISGQEELAKQDIDQALAYASFVGGKRVHVMAGIIEDRSSKSIQIATDTLKTNLSYACSKAQDFGITITIEALCEKVKPHYLYKSQYSTLALVKELNQPNLKVQYDFYHAQMVDGNVTGFLTEHIDSIGHVQIASVPDRHEFDHGELNCAYCLDLLKQLNYSDYVGCEYIPERSGLESVAYLKPYM